MISDEINRAVASIVLKNTEWKVNVRQPQVKIEIEVHTQDTYIMTDKYPGAGGYPVGVGGKAMVMLSGGIDSPIASYLTMKRGVAIECVHYASPPYTSMQAREKVLELARLLAPYQGHILVHIVPFTDLQLAIYEHCEESYAITIMRRMMYRIAERLAQKQNCLAIVNGESIGQVASQTLESMHTINAVTSHADHPSGRYDGQSGDHRPGTEGGNLRNEHSAMGRLLYHLHPEKSGHQADHSQS